ncbi:MAG: hypothetical protein M1812_007095 [Candelaria pacifica]|nr:MAG: hypothetical protein M1812_007095 [Candelaria pacifica]
MSSAPSASNSAWMQDEQAVNEVLQSLLPDPDSFELDSDDDFAAEDPLGVEDEIDEMLGTGPYTTDMWDSESEEFVFDPNALPVEDSASDTDGDVGANGFEALQVTAGIDTTSVLPSGDDSVEEPLMSFEDLLGQSESFFDNEMELINGAYTQVEPSTSRKRKGSDSGSLEQDVSGPSQKKARVETTVTTAKPPRSVAAATAPSRKRKVSDTRKIRQLPTNTTQNIPGFEATGSTSNSQANTGYSHLWSQVPEATVNTSSGAGASDTIATWEPPFAGRTTASFSPQTLGLGNDSDIDPFFDFDTASNDTSNLGIRSSFGNLNENLINIPSPWDGLLGAETGRNEYRYNDDTTPNHFDYGALPGSNPSPYMHINTNTNELRSTNSFQANLGNYPRMTGHTAPSSLPRASLRSTRPQQFSENELRMIPNDIERPRNIRSNGQVLSAQPNTGFGAPNRPIARPRPSRRVPAVYARDAITYRAPIAPMISESGPSNSQPVNYGYPPPTGTQAFAFDTDVVPPLAQAVATGPKSRKRKASSTDESGPSKKGKTGKGGSRKKSGEAKPAREKRGPYKKTPPHISQWRDPVTGRKPKIQHAYPTPDQPLPRGVSYDYIMTHYPNHVDEHLALEMYDRGVSAREMSAKSGGNCFEHTNYTHRVQSLMNELPGRDWQTEKQCSWGKAKNTRIKRTDCALLNAAHPRDLIPFVGSATHMRAGPAYQTPDEEQAELLRIPIREQNVQAEQNMQEIQPQFDLDTPDLPSGVHDNSFSTVSNEPNNSEESYADIYQPQGTIFEDHYLEESPEVQETRQKRPGCWRR